MLNSFKSKLFYTIHLTYSYRYHRIQKHERLKKELKDFEVLQKTNPEAALEKLKDIERARAEERASLRHRNTGQWARSRAIRAKYDHEVIVQLLFFYNLLTIDEEVYLSCSINLYS